MATATVEFDCPQGLALTLELYSPGADTLISTSVATEKTNDLGCYSCSVVDIATATYRARVRLTADTTTISRGILVHTNAVGVEQLLDSAPTTFTVTTAPAAVSGSTLTVHRGDTLTANLTGLGNISTRTKLWFTIKESGVDLDVSSQVQVLVTNPADAVNDGLLYIAGAVATTKANGSIVVTNETTGAITVTVKAVETAKLMAPVDDWTYDVQMLTATAVSTLATGTAKVTADSTRTTS